MLFEAIEVSFIRRSSFIKKPLQLINVLLTLASLWWFYRTKFYVGTIKRKKSDLATRDYSPIPPPLPVLCLCKHFTCLMEFLSILLKYFIQAYTESPRDFLQPKGGFCNGKYRTHGKSAYINLSAHACPILLPNSEAMPHYAIQKKSVYHNRYINIVR